MKSFWRNSLMLGVLLCGSAFAHDGDADHSHTPPTPAEERETHRPTKVPDRIILTWIGDPTTSQAVSWRTDTSVTRAFGQIAVTEGGPQFEKKAKQANATTTRLKTDLHDFHCHSINFTNLLPATKYVYRVGDGVNWSEWFQITTASQQPAPFSFIYFGDSQNSLKTHWSRVIREAYSDAPKARFMIHAGDLVNNARRDAEWGEWFHAGGWMNGMIPSIVTPGNHEYIKVETTEGNSQKSALAPHWRPQFALPENGPAGFEETVYRVDYQGTRILSLNSNERQAEQMAWLEEQLSNNPNTWTILTFHHPLFSSAQKRDNPQLRNLWKPLLDKYRVDLVLQGHDHTYARSKQLAAGIVGIENTPTGANARSSEGGTVYVVSVSGPKMYRVQKQTIMQRVAEDTQLYQIIEIDGPTLRYVARTAAGELYDTFTLRKRPGEINELIEQASATPERVRDK